MTKPLVTPSQIVHNKLVNRKPIRCPVCDRYISPFTGLPVILGHKVRIIEFVHPGCALMSNERPRFRRRKDAAAVVRNMGNPSRP